MNANGARVEGCTPERVRGDEGERTMGHLYKRRAACS